jgi:hypothetical protein
MREVDRKPRHAIPPKVYAVMAVTAAMTFAMLTTTYELLFAHSPFA